MKIVYSANIPDDTYFTSSDVSPIVEDDKLIVYNGKGTHWSWGTPQVTSSVVFNSKRLTAVHVGFSHKHRGGQAWYYYVQGQRRTWAQLDDTLRTLVIKNAKRAPSWAKAPGATRAMHKAAQAILHDHFKARIMYKLVLYLPTGEMRSLYDPGGTIYEIGKKLTQSVQADHKGGYYAYDTLARLFHEVDMGRLSGLVKRAKMFASGRMALLEVECSGQHVEYGTKTAFTHMKPLRIVGIYNLKLVFGVATGLDQEPNLVMELEGDGS